MKEIKINLEGLSKIKWRSVLLYYCTVLSSILILGGLYVARSGREFFSNILFLPLVIFFWITLIEKRRENKKNKISQIQKKK